MPVVAAGDRVPRQVLAGSREERVDVGLVLDEAVEQPVVDGIALGDLEARARHPRIHHVKLRCGELEGVPLDINLVLELAWP